MREARSGLTGLPFAALDLLEGLVEGPEVEPVDDRAYLAGLAPCGIELYLYASVDLPEQLDGPVERPDQLLIRHAAERIGEPLELSDPLLEILGLPPILHWIRTIHQVT